MLEDALLEDGSGPVEDGVTIRDPQQVASYSGEKYSWKNVRGSLIINKMFI